MNLKCKEGDLALITYSIKFPQWIGMDVTVGKFVGKHPIDNTSEGEDWWNITNPTLKEHFDWVICRDYWLMPITPPPEWRDIESELELTLPSIA